VTSRRDELPAEADVVVVGGGIVGRSVASSLSRRGRGVLLIDAGGERFGTSNGNAGHLVPSHVVPFAAPGMVRAGLTSLVRRDGAFAVSRRAGTAAAPWLWRFARSSTQRNVARGVPALREILDLTTAEVHRLRDAGARLDHASGGLLQVVHSAGGADSLRHEHEVMTRWGVRTELLSGAAVAEREPALLPGVTAGLLLCDDERVDPALLLEAVLAEAVAHGTRVARATVASVRRSGAGAVVDTDRGRVAAREVVVAAGVWSPALAASLGAPLPVLAAKGHSVTVEPPPEGVRGPLLLLDQRLAVTQLAAGLRITGGYQLTSPRDRSVDPRRTADLVRRAATALALAPGTRPAHEWSGLRPATPDGVPAIGRLAAAPAVVVATGHGMLGSSAGPGTGELVAEILAGRRTPDALSPDRFHRSVAR
jgi:D-amino-acid dehydrogenase